MTGSGLKRAGCGCRGVLERSEPVPFRLTRNLQTFFTPFGVEGVFITAMAVAAQVSLLFLALWLILLFSNVLVTCWYMSNQGLHSC